MVKILRGAVFSTISRVQTPPGTESGKSTTHTFPFTLHIDEVIPNATARATLYKDAYEPPSAPSTPT